MKINLPQADYDVIHAGLTRLLCARWDEAKAAEARGDGPTCRRAIREYDQALAVMHRLIPI